MSVGVLCRRVPRLHFVTSTYCRKAWRAQCLHSDHVGQEDLEEEGGQASQEAPGAGKYTVLYSPSAYRWLQPNVASLPEADAKEEPVQSPLTATFRHQSNPYSVISSRRLSSTKNVLLDLAFGRGHDAKDEAADTISGEELRPDVRVDPRAFQKCRPEYCNISHDLSSQPTCITPEEAFLVLHKVTVLKANLDPSDIVSFLGKLGGLGPEQQPLARGDTRFAMLLRYGIENLRRFSDNQILEALQAFVRLGLPATHSMLGLYEAELGRRAEEMELQQLLLAADLWRCLGRSVPNYLERLYSRACRAWDQLGLPELVQLLYIIGEGRCCPPALLPPLELVLLQYLDLLMPEEVGAVSLGFFKSQSALSARAARRLADRAHEVVGEMSDYALVNVLKFLRFNHLDHRGLLSALGPEVLSRAPGMGVQGLMHVTLACSSLHYRDDHVLAAVAKRLPQVSKGCRSKDAGKLLWALGTLGFCPSQAPQLFPCLIDALRQRKTEFQCFPQHLLTGLLGLAFLGLFPPDLLSLALSPDFVSLAAGFTQLELKKDLFTLDATVGLELPSWMGPRISQTVAEEMRRQLWSFAQQDVCVKPEVLEAEGLLQELLGGEEFVCKHMILPHTRSIDLEVRLDPDGHPLPLFSATKPRGATSEWASPSIWGGDHPGVTITEDLMAQLTNIKLNPVQPSGSLPHQPIPFRNEVEEREEEVFSGGVSLTESLIEALTSSNCLSSSRVSPSRADLHLAIQVSNRNQYCYRSQQLLGLHAMKRRQLALAGYRLVELPPWEWFPLLHRPRSEKLAYLRCKVLGILD